MEDIKAIGLRIRLLTCCLFLIVNQSDVKTQANNTCIVITSMLPKPGINSIVVHQ